MTLSVLGRYLLYVMGSLSVFGRYKNTIFIGIFTNRVGACYCLTSLYKQLIILITHLKDASYHTEWHNIVGESGLVQDIHSFICCC